MGRKIPLKNIIKYSLKYCGNDPRKLKALYEFINLLLEEKIEKIEKGIEDIKFPFGSQKKLELKLDEKVLAFLKEAEKMGKSASSLLCEILCKTYNINYNFARRKPKQKKLKGTVSLKIPSFICAVIERKERNQDLSKISRKVISEFLEGRIKYEEKSMNHENNLQQAKMK
jgi:hypothetical protein